MTVPAATPPALVDSHCHLDFPDFADELPQVIARARAAGVTRMLTIATRPRTEPASRAIAERFTGVTYAAGLHPLHVAEEPLPTPESLAALAAHPKMVAIGETGLDHHYSADTAARQEASFRIHCEAARRTGLPLIIHARAADADTARILREEHAAGPFGAVMHCFTAGPELAEEALALGFFLSISGVATFPKSDDLRAIFAAAPRDRLLVETDAPYLAPKPKRGKRNEPAYVAMTAAAAADFMGVPFADVAAATTANFDRLFPKAAALARAEAA